MSFLAAPGSGDSGICVIFLHAVTDIGISVVRSNGYLDFIPKALLRTRPNASMEMVVRSSDSGFSDL